MKKIGLGRGLESVMDDEQKFSASRAHTKTHSKWVFVPDAKDRFSQLAQEFYERQYPGCQITFGISNRENIRFSCDQALEVYFRVQAGGAGWPEDTLVIANIYNVYKGEGREPLIELLDFIMMAHRKVGYFKLGFESPGERGMPLVKRFGFKELKHIAGAGYWTISVRALKKRIRAEKVQKR